MAGPAEIEVEGTVIERLPKTMFCVELSNGHRVLARVLPAEREMGNQILPGEKVMLTVSPYDLSKGRITFRRQ